MDHGTQTVETPPPPPPPSRRSSFKHLFVFTTWTHSTALIAAIGAAAVLAAIQTGYSIILGLVFDMVADYGRGTSSGTHTLSQVSKWCIVLVGLGIGSWLASTAFMAFWIVFGELQADASRRVIFRSLLSRDMSWYDSLEQGISGMLVRIQTQTRELQQATSQVLGFLVTDILASIASLIVAFYYSWKLSLALIATLPVSVFIMSLATRRLDPAIEAQKQDLETASKLANASFKAIDLVKVFNGFDDEIWHYYAAIKKAGKQYLIQAQCNSIQMGYVSFWVMAMFVVGFGYGVVLVDQGLTPGHVLTCFYATLAAFQSIEGLLPNWLVLCKGMAAGSFLSSLSQRPVSSSTSPALRPQQCVGNIELSNVSFAYPSQANRAALASVSFKFSAGKTTFLIGKSGSGKSTIGNLIANFYEPLTGTVQLDGQPLHLIDKNWLQSHVTLVPQSSVVFNDSIFNNIAMGYGDSSKVSREDAMAACEFALLQATISCLPEGLDTVVGTSGYSLSGGQKQRLALARARIKDPTVLILDEVTSNLDQASRTLLMDAIREWRKDKTTIIITHDVRHIRDTDFLYVMEEGQLVQQGFKSDLIKFADGQFANMQRLSFVDQARVASPIEFPFTEGGDLCQSPVSPEIETHIDWSSAASKLLLNGLEDDGQSAFRGRTPQQIALGISTASALRMKKQNIWEGVSLETGPRNKSFDDARETWLESSGGRSRPYSRSRIRNIISAPASRRPSLSTTQGLLSNVNQMKSSEDLDYIFRTSEKRRDATSVRLTSTGRVMQQEKCSEGDNMPNQVPSTLATTLKTLWPVLKTPDRVILLLGWLVCLIGAAATPAFAYCFAQLLGVMWDSKNKRANGKFWAIQILVIAIVDGILSGLGHYMFQRVGQVWIDSLRAEAFKRILQQPKAWFQKEKNSASRINECLDRNAEETRNIVGRFIPIMTFVVCVVFASTIWAIVVSWKLTLVALSPVPLVIVSVKTYTMVSSRWETRCNESAEESSACLSEICTNIQTVRAMGLKKHFRAKYFGSISLTFNQGLRRAAYSCALYGFYQSVKYPLIALVFYFASVLLSKNNHTTTQVLQVVNLLLFSIGTATEGLGNMPQLTMAQATATQLLGYTKLPMPERVEDEKRNPSSALPIEARDLEFSYSKRSRVLNLHDVSFYIEPGTCTAIVGSSGCGKSTLISILMGLYPPGEDTAQLSFGGVLHHGIDMQQLRSKMGYVPQTPFLFPATIGENIAYGLPKDSPYRSLQSLHDAAQAAGIHDFISSLPEGYATLVGEGGQALSGGQSQRLSIARALIRKPSLLIMDEPTSALDVESSAMIRETISSLVEKSRQSHSDLAIILVTHSLDMMQVAGNIIVLENGTTVEEGTFDELFQSGEHFRSLLHRVNWRNEIKDELRP